MRATKPASVTLTLRYPDREPATFDVPQCDDLTLDVKYFDRDDDPWWLNPTAYVAPAMVESITLVARPRYGDPRDVGPVYVMRTPFDPDAEATRLAAQLAAARERLRVSEEDRARLAARCRELYEAGRP